MARRSGPDINIVVARSTFWVSVHGRQRLVHRGDAYPADDPIVSGNAQMFEPLRLHSSSEPERRTA